MTPIFFLGHREKRNESLRILTSSEENVSLFRKFRKMIMTSIFFQGHREFVFLFNDWVFELLSHTHHEKTLSIGILVTNVYSLTTRALSDKGHLVTSGHLVTNASCF